VRVAPITSATVSECVLTGNFVPAVDRLAGLISLAGESKRVRALIVMNVPTEYDVNFARLEDVRQKPHMLVAEVGV
jgi:hypothetical protein